MTSPGGSLPELVRDIEFLKRHILVIEDDVHKLNDTLLPILQLAQTFASEGKLSPAMILGLRKRKTEP